MEILAYRFAPGFLDLSLALHEFYQVCLNSSWIKRFLWIYAGVGFLVPAGVQWRDSDQKRRPCVLASWWGGLLLISVVVPLVEHGILKALHRTPFEFGYLIRGLRYTIPLVWMTAFWVLSEVYNVFLQRSAGERLFGGGLWAGLVMVVGVGMAAAWSNQNQLIDQRLFGGVSENVTRGFARIHIQSGDAP